MPAKKKTKKKETVKITKLTYKALPKKPKANCSTDTFDKYAKKLAEVVKYNDAVDAEKARREGVNEMRKK